MKRKNKKMAANAEGVNEPVRDWLLREHPDEKTMIGSFSKTVTFDEVARRMRAGENFYDIYQEFFVIRNSSHRLFVLGLVI